MRWGRAKTEGLGPVPDRKNDDKRRPVPEANGQPGPRLSFRDRVVCAFLSTAAWLLMTAIGATLRVRLVKGEALSRLQQEGRGVLLVCWHGRVFVPAYFMRGRGVRVLVSLSRDGEFAAQLLRRLGFCPVRGSTSRGSIRALLSAARVLGRGHTLAVTPDGPRGPSRQVSLGTIHLAALSQCPIIPVGVGVTRRKHLRSWDQYVLPYPFSTSVLFFGDPVFVARHMTAHEVEEKRQEVAEAISRLEVKAEELAREEAQRPQLSPFYNLVLACAIPLLVLYTLWEVYMKRKTKHGLLQQLGRYPASGAPNPGAHPTVWVQAVSVGEVMAARPITQAVRKRFPDCRIVVTTTTDTGQRSARDLLTEADETLYFPLDFPWAVRAAFDRIQPEVLLMVETELWPNVLAVARQRGVHTMLVNGRVSDRMYCGAKSLPFLYRKLLGNVDLFSMRSETDRRRLLAIGAPPERVRLTGDVKRDLPLRRLGTEDRKQLRRRLGFPADHPVLLAGSTHPGEELQIVDSWQELRLQFPSVHLVLAPRHVERAEEIERSLGERGVKVRRKTALPPDGHVQEPACVLLVDTIGELAALYAIADVTFVGGSLIPRGGHNLLEPVQQGKPVFFGPFVHNFRDAARVLVEKGVGWQVSSARELARLAAEMLADPQQLDRVAHKAQELLSQGDGAAWRTAELAGMLLDGRGVVSGEL